MTRLLSWITALTLLVAAGVLHGLWSERWRPADALEAAAVRLEQVPLEIGDWQGKAIDTDAESFAQAGAAATGRAVTPTATAAAACWRS